MFVDVVRPRQFGFPRSAIFVARHGNQRSAIWFHPPSAANAPSKNEVFHHVPLGPPGGRQGCFGGFALTSDNKAPEKPKKGAVAQSKNRDMGSALRSVYQKTVEEAVPEDLMSLLGKLD